MKKGFFAVSLVTVFLSCNNAFADEACLLETDAMFMGVKLDVKDCVQNAGLAEDTFKAQCEGLSQAVVAMGGPAAKITYLSSCPVPFQAKCDNTDQSRAVFFYYKRAADEAAGLEASCNIMQGTYTQGSLN
ncbi:MAG: hypothetical protein VX939_05465 [Pseudomonadota bacterium]|nr:hypothetical protein [Pseudomonadota bacterium]